MSFDRLVLYCRPGFEKECAAEIQERCAMRGTPGFARTQEGQACVEFVPTAGDALALMADLDFGTLIFARQMIAAQHCEGLPPADRIGPLLARLGERPVSAVFTETPDTNAGKELSALCRKIAPPLRAALQARGLLRAERPELPRLHILFTGSTQAYIGLSDARNASAWPMGIPRLRFPRAAPSRSTLKLEEALLFFLDDKERRQRLRAGMVAVDLGASPGGWTWQLVHRGLRVIAVDNGPMDEALMASGAVEHRREDGFRYRPAKPVDWMVCDMVEQPARVARLVGRWIAHGWCHDTLFNLKLPMKKRHAQVQQCEELIRHEVGNRPVSLRLRQLYHDRDEVTGYLYLLR